MGALTRVGASGGVAGALSCRAGEPLPDVFLFLRDRFSNPLPSGRAGGDADERARARLRAAWAPLGADGEVDWSVPHAQCTMHCVRAAAAAAAAVGDRTTEGCAGGADGTDGGMQGALWRLGCVLQREGRHVLLLLLPDTAASNGAGRAAERAEPAERARAHRTALSAHVHASSLASHNCTAHGAGTQRALLGCVAEFRILARDIKALPRTAVRDAPFRVTLLAGARADGRGGGGGKGGRAARTGSITISSPARRAGSPRSRAALVSVCSRARARRRAALL